MAQIELLITLEKYPVGHGGHMVSDVSLQLEAELLKGHTSCGLVQGLQTVSVSSLQSRSLYWSFVQFEHLRHTWEFLGE